ncbi:MAG: arsenite methyltransferase [Acidobacteria bacterium]|nr:arsenite methyltransferase [Acidobacteriota bacterium]
MSSETRGKSRLPAAPDEVVAEVQERYSKIATGEISGCCSGTGCGSVQEEIAAGIGYSADDLAAIPEGANLGLGCGAPVPWLKLQPGETVVDLGAGAGVDAFLAARQVGPQGKVIGVDMTPAMLEKARAFAASSGFAQVEFREGRLENLPVADASVDAVTSNCVINLVPDKSAVFREIARILKPGGRLVISDMILDGELPASVRTSLLAYVGCVAGAMRREAYFEMLAAAGLGQLKIHRDVDYLKAAQYAVDPELQTILDQNGINVGSLTGLVRSVTYEARRD